MTSDKDISFDLLRMIIAFCTLVDLRGSECEDLLTTLCERFGRITKRSDSLSG